MHTDTHTLQGRYTLRAAGVNETNRQGDEDLIVTFPDGSEKRVNVWDYDQIYRYPFLYEAIYLDFFHYDSPHEMAKFVVESLATEQHQPLRVLDLAAGSGLNGVALKSQTSCEVLVGLDLLASAKDAAMRDHPGTYDAYYAYDLLKLSPEERHLLESYRFNVVMIGSATGGDDVLECREVEFRDYKVAFNLLKPGGYIVTDLREHIIPGQKVVLDKLLEHADLCSQKLYHHRDLLSGESVNHIVYMFKKRDDWSE